jgi:S1-C subfamily serine protease
VNSLGEVVGINTFIFSTGDGGNLGLGFAIPINRGQWVLDEIKEYGHVRTAWTGLHVRAITPQMAAGLNYRNRRGLLVREIVHGSPAERAGFEPGDLVIEINGTKVETLREGNRIIFGTRIGEAVSVTFERDREIKELDLVLEEKKDEI